MELTIDFRKRSTLDKEALREAAEGVDYVFHLADRVRVPESRGIGCQKSGADAFNFVCLVAHPCFIDSFRPSFLFRF